MNKANQYFYKAVICLFSITSLYGGIRLPENFYAILADKAISSIPIKDEAPIFYIMVPECSVRPTKNPEKIKSMQAFMKNVEVPADFFSKKMPQKTTKPIALFYNWEEQENHKTRKQASLKLAKGIDTLRYRFKKSKIIMVGLGQGGNIINGASQSVRLPLEVVIQLSNPIFPNSKKTHYTEYIPSKKKIKRMYSFYTEQDFSILHPTLHPHYERVYMNSTHSQLANILLLINNKHPLPVETMRPLIGKKLLSLCKKIKDSYLMHNHLVAHLSTVKPTTDMVIVLRNNDTFGKKRKKITERVIQERLMSKVRMKKFEKEWGRPMALALNKGEKSRKKYESIKKQTAQQKRV